MRALAAATRAALAAAGVTAARRGHRARHHRIHRHPCRTGLQPLDDYYLWCDHRAWREAAEITARPRQPSLEAIEWCGGIYSSEWGFSKLLHWLRNNPASAAAWPPPWSTATWSPPSSAASPTRDQVPRSDLRHGPQVDVERCAGRAAARGVPHRRGSAAGRRSREARRPLCHLRPDRRPALARMGRQLGLRAGIPIPVGAFDAHWDAIGAGVREGDVVNVVGTSTCIMAIADEAEPDPRRLRRGPGLHPSRL